MRTRGQVSPARRIAPLPSRIQRSPTADRQARGAGDPLGRFRRHPAERSAAGVGPQWLPPIGSGGGAPVGVREAAPLENGAGATWPGEAPLVRRIFYSPPKGPKPPLARPLRPNPPPPSALQATATRAPPPPSLAPASIDPTKIQLKSLASPRLAVRRLVPAGPPRPSRFRIGLSERSISMALPCTVASCRLLSHLCSWCMVATGSPFAHIIAHNRSHPFWLLWPWLILVSTPSRVSSSSSASACQFLQVEAAS